MCCFQKHNDYKPSYKRDQSKGSCIPSLLDATFNILHCLQQSTAKCWPRLELERWRFSADCDCCFHQYACPGFSMTALECWFRDGIKSVLKFCCLNASEVLIQSFFLLICIERPPRLLVYGDFRVIYAQNCPLMHRSILKFNPDLFLGLVTPWCMMKSDQDYDSLPWHDEILRSVTWIEYDFRFFYHNSRFAIFIIAYTYLCCCPPHAIVELCLGCHIPISMVWILADIYKDHVHV